MKREKRKQRERTESREEQARKGRPRFGRHRPFLFSFSTLGLFNLDREKKLTTPFEKKKQKRKKPNLRTSYQLAPEDELNWDDGTANPEYCVDRWDDVGKYQALKWLLGGLGVFGGALTLASVLDKRSEIPFTPREYPFDSLKKELNGSKGVGPRD